MSLEIGPDFGNYALKGIEEIAFPPPIPWWPVAPGWRWLGLMLLVGLGWLAYRRFRRWQRDAYRRDALRRLAEIERSSASWQEVVSALPLLLKAVALDAYPRGEVIGLVEDEAGNLGSDGAPAQQGDGDRRGHLGSSDSTGGPSLSDRGTRIEGEEVLLRLAAQHDAAGPVFALCDERQLGLQIEAFPEGQFVALQQVLKQVMKAIPLIVIIEPDQK